MQLSLFLPYPCHPCNPWLNFMRCTFALGHFVLESRIHPLQSAHLHWLMKCIAFVFFLAVQLAFASGSGPLPAASPKRLGFSPERLERLHKAVQAYIDEGKHAGAISIIVRDGKIADFATYGYRDLEAKTPMTPDTICRVYSMSKVITSAAVMQLVERGEISLTDPVSKYIPEFKSMKVCTGGTAEEPTLVDATNAITVKHLLTHTAGLAYDFSQVQPVRQLYAKADLWKEDVDFKEFIRRVSKLPLVHQPGTAFHYGVNTDVLGYLVEVVSRKPLETYMQENLFGPLRMVDTSFDVPEPKRTRLAKLYERGTNSALREVLIPPYGTYAEKGKGFTSGGGGLFSTAGDYVRFAQMLLNGGKLDGQQVLGRKTIELMTSNNLTFLSNGTLNSADGFGLGGSVRLDVPKGNTLGSVGQFGWNGAATTTFNIDPHERTVALLFTQHLPYNEYNIFAKFYTLFYAALE
jgi:CubicO group peptidase (beta-lactamase class C family)